MSQKMVIVNDSKSKGAKEAQEISTRSLGFGALILTAKAIKMVMATLAIVAGQEENGQRYIYGNVPIERHSVHEDRRKLTRTNLWDVFEGVWKPAG
jgi:hypothetical protein